MGAKDIAKTVAKHVNVKAAAKKVDEILEEVVPPEPEPPKDGESK